MHPQLFCFVQVVILRKSLELEQKAAEVPSFYPISSSNGNGGSSEGSAADTIDSKPLAKEVDDNAHQLFTCETAQYFLLQEVLPRWEKFIAEAAKLLKGGEVPANESVPSDFVANNFPFNSFITGLINPPRSLIKSIFPVS